MASTLRLRRKDVQTPSAPHIARHTGILQDQLRRSARRPWNPDFAAAVRILLLVRVAGAMYSNIQDCDEVFNFWEPLHYLDQGYGFQTWEATPAYAIRSWAYVLLHLMPARLALSLRLGKRPAFFAVRIALAVASTLCEATLCRTVVEKINERVGRYLFFMLLFSAGMWSAAPAFLPSSFAMCANTLAFAYALEPSSAKNKQRTLLSTFLFATGAIAGWPFALALALPFVFEELFVSSGDHVEPISRSSWMVSRWIRFFNAGLISALIFVPVIAIDTAAYGRWNIVPWNIVRYNVFGGSDRGPNLYGTAPWYFYIFNLLLNFNVLVPLAFLSLPCLAITRTIDRKRLGTFKSSAAQTSPFTLLTLRLAPLYVWTAILTMQAHKEERFMFPAYPLLCFNAAVCLYLVRGWIEVAYISTTKSSYQASRSFVFSATTCCLVTVAGLVSLSRILALWHHYHAPLFIFNSLESSELPRLLNVTGLLPPILQGTDESDRSIDLEPIREFDLRLCLGKEWYRFPGHYLVPNGVKVDFVKSEFDGLLPAHFEGSKVKSNFVGWWNRPGSRITPGSLNDLNKEAPEFYVPVESCDYFVDLDFARHPVSTPLEPRYVIDSETWERVSCFPFLDASHSTLLTRTLWFPGTWWQSKNSFGDYCLLKNRERVHTKEIEVAARVQEEML